MKRSKNPSGFVDGHTSAGVQEPGKPSQSVASKRRVNAHARFYNAFYYNAAATSQGRGVSQSSRLKTGAHDHHEEGGPAAHMRSAEAASVAQAAAAAAVVAPRPTNRSQAC